LQSFICNHGNIQKHYQTSSCILWDSAWARWCWYLVPSDQADGSWGPVWVTAVAVLSSVDGSCLCDGAQRLRIALLRCNSQSLGIHFLEGNFV